MAPPEPSVTGTLMLTGRVVEWVSFGDVGGHVREVRKVSVSESEVQVMKPCSDSDGPSEEPSAVH
jgi:hypothetical protein